MTAANPIDALLEVAACPDDHQPLARAPDALVAQLNAAITDRSLRQRNGDLVDEAMETAFITVDHVRAYPIRAGVAILLKDAAIILTEADKATLS